MINIYFYKFKLYFNLYNLLDNLLNPIVIYFFTILI